MPPARDLTTRRIPLPDGTRYYTVLDGDYQLHPVLNGWLFHLRYGRDLAESTTQSYALFGLLYLRWCRDRGMTLADGAYQLGAFTLFLRFYRLDEQRVVLGREVRCRSTISRGLSIVRELLKHLVATGEAAREVLSALYELGDDNGHPAHLRGRHPGRRTLARPRHRVRGSKRRRVPATHQEFVALAGACLNARDRFIIICLGLTGLRRGEITGLRLQDVHALPDSKVLDCSDLGPHLHVERRQNENGAWAKSHDPRSMPLDDLVVQAWHAYVAERDETLGDAVASDYALVNLFRGAVGGPMRLGALNELMDMLSRRAGLPRRLSPHSLRHYYTGLLYDGGARLDEISELLGHSSPYSLSDYSRPTQQRLRAAVDGLREQRRPPGSP